MNYERRQEFSTLIENLAKKKENLFFLSELI